MDLRPINPYYRKTEKERSPVRSARKRAANYSYPYNWIEPVTDRTPADVDHARQVLALDWADMDAGQREEYLAGLKGCLNRTDLERVENNIQILLDVLEIDAESHVGNIPDIPDADYFAGIQDNISAIRSGYCIHTDTPPVPEAPLNTWQKWNDLEKILKDVYEIICNNFHYYAGEKLYAGESTALIL